MENCLTHHKLNAGLSREEKFGIKKPVCDQVNKKRQLQTCNPMTLMNFPVYSSSCHVQGQCPTCTNEILTEKCPAYVHSDHRRKQNETFEKKFCTAYLDASKPGVVSNLPVKYLPAYTSYTTEQVINRTSQAQENEPEYEEILP